MAETKYINRLKTVLLTFVVSVLFASACRKNNDYDFPITPISRLYVSLADTGTNAYNALLFINADKDTLPNAYRFQSNQADGNGIMFSPYTGNVYQVSRASKSVKTLVPRGDTLSNGTSFSDSTLISARGIAFAKDSNVLFVASNKDSSISVYRRFTSLSGQVKPSVKLKNLGGQPWDVFFDRTRLFVAFDSVNTVMVITNAAKIDTTTSAQSLKVSINGAGRLHGIYYSQRLDMLFLTDIGRTTPLVNPSILVIENANAKLLANSVITPTRIIRSPLMTNPVDISVDDREGKGLIYIAEKATKKILVFKVSDNGNATPTSKPVIGSPESLYIDARDKSSVPGY